MLFWIFALFLGGCEALNPDDSATYYSPNDSYSDCTGGLGSLGRCPEKNDKALIVDHDLFCEQTLSDVSCYSVDPRPNRIMTQNSLSPLVEQRARYVPLPKYTSKSDKDNKPRISSFAPMPINSKIIPANRPPSEQQ